MADTLERIANLMRDASSMVAFTGAGISTESGIPDFRSPGGVWAQNKPVYYDDFLASAEARYEYWRQKSISHQDFMNADPNTGHLCLAKWENDGPVSGVVTQNIDGLHQVAGSRCVLEIHGTARFVACLDCQTRYNADEMVAKFLADDCPPNCPACGGITKHATISFGQSLSESVLEAAMELGRQAEIYFAIGSSLVVQPAASLPMLAKESGAKLVIVNRDPTPLDSLADFVVRSPIGETLSAIDELL